MPTGTRTMGRRGGFTLIELLVVVAIIALLISILLPSLGNARRLAKTVVCASRFHAVGQSMMTYASEWQGAIVGNAYSTGSFLFRDNPAAPGTLTTNPLYSNTSCPNIITSFDFMSPLAAQMNIPFEKGGSTGARMMRFTQLVQNPNFMCTENDIVAMPYGSPNPGAHRMISFNTASLFQYAYGASDGFSTLSYVNLGSYKPKLDRVGNPSQKIFLADGGRWWNGTGELQITTNFDIFNAGSGASPGGAFADYGPWSAYSRAFQRSTGGLDGLTVSMRHGERRPGRPMASYRTNVVFFDGHSETLNGLQAANPHLWAPTGTTIDSSEANDVAKSTYWTTNPLVIR